jgi:hypothetical protein
MKASRADLDGAIRLGREVLAPWPVAELSTNSRGTSYFSTKPKETVKLSKK